MARTVTLLQLRTDIAAQCDFSTSTTGRYTPTLLNRLINQSIQRFRERISNEGITHYLVPYSGTISSGATGDYSFRTLDLSALSPPLVRTYGLDIRIANVVKTLAHRPFTERNEFSIGPERTGQPIAWAHFQTNSLAVMPAPDADYPYTVWYLPVLADLSGDSDTFDGVAGWEVWVLWDCVCQLIARDQYQAAYQQAIQERDLAWQDIVRSSTKVSASGGAFVGRDTMGQAGLMGARPRLSREVGASSGPITADTIFGVPDEAGQRIASVPDNTVSAGFSWQKRRFWIEPSIDLTGAVDASAAINAASLAAYGSGGRTGCVYLPEGRIRLDNPITVQYGTVITGPERGMSSGYRVFNDGTGLQQTGALILRRHTGKGFILKHQARVLNLECYDPDQASDATPTVYDWLFYIAANEPGCTVANITAINPYKLLSADSCFTAEEVYGLPLSCGIEMKRLAEVSRLRSVHFNNIDYATGSTLRAWILANGKAFTVDAAEQFEFTDCFANGYLGGIWFEDQGSGGGSYGSWKGGGFDNCGFCVVVAADPGLGGLGGLAMSDANMIPAAGGYGVICQDTATPAHVGQAPMINMSGVSMWQGGGYPRGVWIKSGSYSFVSWRGGACYNQTSARIHNQSSNGGYLSDGLMRRTSETGDVADAGCAGLTVNEIVRPFP